MLTKLSKILADPDRTIVGGGRDALVLTRRKVNANGAVVPPGSRTDRGPMRGDSSAPPLNPIEKASRDTLSQAEQDVVRELKDRDRDVRRHEQQHMAAAGDLAKGGPRYHYQIGPDGKPYAVGGEIQIDTSSIPGDPEANRHKAARVRRAALAPGDASGPDLVVAGNAHNRGAARVQGTHAGAEYLRNDAEVSAADRNELRLFA
ncbi:MAG: putative metalloprotease CJM1_0395 family protein [Leptospirales bacterium]|jgi:hypothetical protein